MSPNLTNQAILLATSEIQPKSEFAPVTNGPPSQNIFKSSKENPEYEWQISWRNVAAFVYLHVTTLYGMYLLFAGRIMFATTLWQLAVTLLTGIGITAGAHRLWAHKAYKATWQLRLILAIFQTMAFQNHIYEWARDHRVHHKFTDTDADPHNANRGFFFSHIGWLMVKKHPDVKNKGSKVDMSDLDDDLIVVWQRRTYIVIMPLLCFVMPTWVPIRFWGEDPWMAWYSTIVRYTFVLNGTWLVNSAAHIWGNKPYDVSISSVENRYVSVLAVGEGWHNYHHVFPWDYKAAELGNYKGNITTAFIDFFAKIGWAYNLRTVDPQIVKSRAARTGDGTLRDQDDPNHHMNNIWGWDDPDLQENDRKVSPEVNKRDD